MKVALATYLFGPQMARGAAVAAWRLARGLCAQGDKVVVISTHAERRMTVEHTKVATVYRFFPRNLYWLGDKDRQPVWKKVPWQLIDIWNPHTFRIVQRILEREQPDVIHVHKLRGLSPSIWAAARCAGIPVVQTCHDYELLSPEGTLSSRVGSWASEGAWFLRWYSWIRARFSCVVAAATAPCHYALQMLTARGFFPRAVKRVIPNSHGLTRGQLDRRRRDGLAKTPRDAKAMHLLYLGRLEAIKGVDLLCAAFERCAARCPQLYLDIAGWGSVESQLRERHGQHPRIVLHGTVVGKDKECLLARNDVLVLPSIWPETFGMVIVEAYVYGKPVIVSRAGGMPELVREGETGFVVPAGNVQALVDTLCQVAKAPDTVRAMSNACFGAARQYTLESVANEYRALYERVLR